MIALRISRLAYALGHPACWRAMAQGVSVCSEHRAVIQGLDCDHLLDVGANRGQFTLLAQIIRPGLSVHAYEPLSQEANVFRALHAHRPSVKLYELALGDQPGVAEIHVSGRADSSSLLPIGELQAKLFPNTKEVGRRSVTVAKLDSFPDHWREYSRILLKIDVQGFELSVLRGATEALRHCAYVYAECSEFALYEGQALRTEVAAFLREQGFGEPVRYNPYYEDGKVIQADYLFTRLSNTSASESRLRC